MAVSIDRGVEAVIIQVRCEGRPDFALHLQTSLNAGCNQRDQQNQNIAFHGVLLAEEGPAAADGENCKNKFGQL